MSIRTFSRRLSAAAVEKARLSAHSYTIRLATDPAYRRALSKLQVRSSRWSASAVLRALDGQPEPLPPPPAEVLAAYGDGISRTL